MNNIQEVAPSKNAGLAAFYRIADGRVPIYNQKIGIPPCRISEQCVRQILSRFTSEFAPLRLVHYAFGHFERYTCGALTRSVRFHALISNRPKEEGIEFELTLEERSGEWGVRNVTFYPTPAQAERYFYWYQTSYDLLS